MVEDSGDAVVLDDHGARDQNPASGDHPRSGDDWHVTSLDQVDTTGRSVI